MLGVTFLDDLLQLPTARGSAHYRKIALSDDLPRRPGVYMFKDRNGSVFYVGKATNLRSRVRSYFYGDDRRSVTDMMRELHSIDYRVCETAIEAEVTELRMIHSHRPRHNRRSKPPKASHFVKLTREAFPRLSLVRTLKEDGECYLGPFRTRRAAETVLLALWDAVPIRRCSGRPGTRSTTCAMAQMGVALCPCDGTLTREEYSPVVELLREGIDSRPELLLQPLAERMERMAAEQRFEEAAVARDRHRALARALERRRAWRALCDAGTIEVLGADGERVLIQGGRLVHSWKGPSGPPLTVVETADSPPTPVPPDVLAAEEAHLLWRWLCSEGVRLIHADGPLQLPARRVPALAV